MPHVRRAAQANKADDRRRRRALQGGGAATTFKDFFDNNDPNKDGKITRDEWDAMLKFMAEARTARSR